MQKVEGSSPFIRFARKPRKRGAFAFVRVRIEAPHAPGPRSYAAQRKPVASGRGASGLPGMAPGGSSSL